MKTPAQLQNEIDKIEQKYQGASGNDRRTKEYKKDASTIADLRKMKAYLETNPGEESLVMDRNQIQNRLKMVDTEAIYLNWYNRNSANKRLKNPHGKFNEVMGITQMKVHMKMLDYLLH